MNGPSVDGVGEERAGTVMAGLRMGREDPPSAQYKQTDEPLSVNHFTMLDKLHNGREGLGRLIASSKPKRAPSIAA